MSNDQDRPAALPWPPILYLGALAAGVALHWFVPLPWLLPPLSEFLFAVGWLVVAAAIAIYFAAIRTMRRANTTVAPNRASQHLVTSGPFSFTRNPLYLANTMVMIGIGLIAGIVWLILLAPIAAFATQKLAIEGEERHLEARFGKKYRDYARKVRRWV